MARKLFYSFREERILTKLYNKSDETLGLRYRVKGVWTN